MTEYLNIDERYGDELPVTVADYQELNPDGEFEATSAGIFEHTGHNFERIGHEWKLIAIAIDTD